MLLVQVFADFRDLHEPAVGLDHLSQPVILVILCGGQKALILAARLQEAILPDQQIGIMSAGREMIRVGGYELTELLASRDFIAFFQIGRRQAEVIARQAFAGLHAGLPDPPT